MSVCKRPHFSENRVICGGVFGEEYILLQMDTFADDAFNAVFSVAQWEEEVGLCIAFLSPL